MQKYRVGQVVVQRSLVLQEHSSRAGNWRNHIVNSCAPAVLEEVLKNISDKIGPQRYKVWFADLTQVNLTDGTVTVIAPNSFVANWIRKHYANLLTDTASEITGHQCRLNLEVSAKQTEAAAKPSENKRRVCSSTAKRNSAGERRSASQVDQLRFNLDNFVVGPSNQLAFATAQSVIGQPRVSFNPLFIHGSCGLGKTHLLQGICNAVMNSQPMAKCIYISGEEFTNRFIMALRGNRVNGFRQRFRQVDVLAIDDIHFLANKRATQEEFLHTFNSIETQGKQVILASDTHPKLLGAVIESLVSRFLAGMVVKIETPNYQTRLAILQRRSKCLNINVDTAVLEYAARHVRGNVRELEGALLRLKAYSGLTHQPASLSMATHVLSDYLGFASGPAGIEDLQQIVSNYFGLVPVDLQSPRRNSLLSLARSVGMYLTRQHTGMSYPEIGRAFGRRSHASVISACKKLEGFLAEQKQIEWTTAGGRCERQNVSEVVSKLSAQITKSA